MCVDEYWKRKRTGTNKKDVFGEILSSPQKASSISYKFIISFNI